MTFTFDGFEPANTTPVPDVLFDVMLSKLTGAELKVLLYIIRRTTGFKKTTDTISFTQFEKGIIKKDGEILDCGTGLSRETISKALAGLEAKGCIKSYKRVTVSGDNDITVYSIRFKGDVVGKSDYQTWSEKTTTVVGKSDQGSRKIRPGVVGKSDPQLNSNTRNSLQETVKQEGVATSAEDRTAHPLINLEMKRVEKRETDPRHPAISVSSHSQSLSEEETVKMPAIAKGQSDHGTDHNSTGDSGIPGGLREDVHRSGGGDTPLIEQKPGASPLPSAVTPSGGHGDASAQASSQQTISTTLPRAPAATALTSSPRSSVQQGAGTKRPRTKKPVILELTLQGLQVKSWYEEVRGSKLRMTAGNVTACNALGECEECTLDSLKAVIEHLDGLAWVKEHDFAIDIQVLAKDDSRLNFEKNWPLVRRKLALKAKQDERNNGDYSDFDRYVGNGPEERAALLAEYEVRKANGTLAW